MGGSFSNVEIFVGTLGLISSLVPWRPDSEFWQLAI